MIVLSTHLDDAVWSAHSLLAGATVITICAGIPANDVEPSHFDLKAGFRTGRDAVEARRAEDLAAAGRVGFTPVHLNVLDGLYGAGDINFEVRAALEHAGDEVVVGPVGLRHPDHYAVADAFKAAAVEFGLNAWCYEDLPYTHVWPEPERLAGFGRVIERPSAESKREAVCLYRSQVAGAHMDEILGVERFHHYTGRLAL